MITSRRLKTRWENVRPGPALSVIPVLSRRARIGDSGTRLSSAAHSHALQLGAPRLPLVPRRRPLAACSSALPAAAAAQRRAAAAASIVARERTRQRTVPVSRRDLGASWCRTRPITRYVAAVMRSFQQVLASSEHIWYGANTLPPANLVWFAIKEVLSPQALRSTTGCQSSACPRELLVPRTCSLFWTRHRRELARYLGLLDGVDYY